MRMIFVSLMVLLVLSLLVSAKITYKTVSDRTSSPTKTVSDVEPFVQMAQFIRRFGKGSDFERYSVEEIGQAMKVLSKSQSALKSMDGATHQFRNVFKESSSLGGRYEKFVNSKRKRLKEAAKIYEYTKAVERAMQSTEILQSIAAADNNERTSYLKDAGLIEVKRSVVTVAKIRCIVSILRPIETSATGATFAPGTESDADVESAAQTPRRASKAARAEDRRKRSEPKAFLPGELIIAVTDAGAKQSTNIAQLLRLINREKASSIQLDVGYEEEGDNSMDNAEEHGRQRKGSSATPVTRKAASSTLSVQPTLIKLAGEVLAVAKDYILCSDIATNPEAVEKLPEVEVSSTGGAIDEGICTSKDDADGDADDDADSVIVTSESTTRSVASIVRSTKGKQVTVRNNHKMDAIYIGRGGTRKGKSNKNSSLDEGKKASLKVGGSSSSTGTSTSRRNRRAASTSTIENNTVGDSEGESARAEPLYSEEDSELLSISGDPLPDRVRVIGYSVGGAVAAYTSIILDGDFLQQHRSKTVAAPDSTTSQQDEEEEEIVATMKGGGGVQKETKKDSHTQRKFTYADKLLQEESIQPFIGAFCNRVQCFALGPPPCIGRSTVPRYVQSIICGDDVIPRAQVGALQSLRTRVLRALQSGAGKKGTGSLRYVLGAGMLSDLSSIAGKSLDHYKGKSSKDINQLSVPGRVFFIKPRKLKEGATIQRVLRGNWQEDMLWQLHDVLLSKRMLEHHSLDSYIRTLNRC